jgi:CheY-like chemotaxis protein
MELENVLADAGCDPVRIASSVPEALQAVSDTAPDIAVLDVSIKGDPVFPVADALASTAVPFVLLTGHSLASMPERLRDRPFLVKPYDPARLVDLLAEVIAEQQNA